MTFKVGFLARPEKRRQRLVRWLHSTESSSWWSWDIVDADSAEAAAANIGAQVDIKKHTSYRDRRLRVRVYGPIPEGYEEFYISDTLRVDASEGTEPS
jgi:hypothetical protein